MISLVRQRRFAGYSATPRGRPGGRVPRTGRAFTLLEVLLAVALTMGLAGIMLAFHDEALEIRRTVTEEAEAAAAERVIMDRITDELRGAMVYPFISFGMEGQSDQVRFIGAAIPGPAAWHVREATEDPVPPEQDLQLVGYRLRIIEEDDGTITIVGLERTCQKVLSVQVAEEGREIETALLTPRFKFIQFSYFDGGGWQDSWSGGDLPLGVEIRMGVEPLPEDTEPIDYPYPTFRRVVYMPGSTQALSGTVVRGLGERGGP